jgi:hypothetical protein
VANFDELIPHLNREYPDEWSRGKALERICKWILIKDPSDGAAPPDADLEGHRSDAQTDQRSRRHPKAYWATVGTGGDDML